MKRIYLDYASTTPMDPEVKAAMEPYFCDKFGNPGAMHGCGQEAQAAVDKARQKVADFLGCNFTEIVFTASATESNNLAIRGIVKNVRGFAPHIITSAIEHKSVLETCKDLERYGVEVTYLPVNKDGIVDPKDVEKAIKENTALVSIGYVNNEIGAIQPITKIANIIRNFRNSKHEALNSKQIRNSKSKTQNKNNVSDFGFRISDLEAGYPLLHTDAVQALNYLDCNVEKLGVDMFTFSGHKIYGPKGIGVLYIRRGVSVAPIITGGNQERGFRSGTENVPYIVGVGKAVELAGERKEKEAARLQELRDYFIKEVLEKVQNSEFNGSHEKRIANNANILFRGVPANNLLIALDQEGIAASSGSTCSIKTTVPSHVISALGRSDEEANQSIRFTLGCGTTKEDIDYTVSALQKIIKKMV